jgi:hypothetical protein
LLFPREAEVGFRNLLQGAALSKISEKENRWNTSGLMDHKYPANRWLSY